MKIADLAAQLKLEKERISKVFSDAGMSVTEDQELDNAAVELLLKEVAKLTEGLAPVPAPVQPAAQPAGASLELTDADLAAAVAPAEEAKTPAAAAAAEAPVVKKATPSLKDLSENLGIPLADLTEHAAAMGITPGDPDKGLTEEEGNKILDNLHVIVSSIQKKRQAKPSAAAAPASEKPAQAPAKGEAAESASAARSGSPLRIALNPFAVAAGFAFAFLFAAVILLSQRQTASRPHEELPPAPPDEKRQAGMVWKTAEEGYYHTAYELSLAFEKEFPRSVLREDVAFKRGEILFAWERKPASVQFSSCAKALEQAVSQFPESPRVARALFLAAQCYLRLGNNEKAADAFSRLIRGYPAFEPRDEILFRHAGCLAQLKRFPEAADTYRTLIRRFPRSAYCPEALYLLAGCWRELKKYDRALETYGSFLARYPRDMRRDDAVLAIASMYYEKGDYDRAISLFKKSIGKYPFDKHNDEAYLMLAKCRGRQEAFKDASAWLDQLIFTYPDSARVPEANFLKAEFLRNQGRAKEAAQQYEKVLEKYPSDERAFSSAVALARLYSSDKEYGSAARVCGVILSKYPNAPGNDAIRLLMSEALKSQGKTALALDGFDRLIKDYPASDLIEQAYFQKADCEFALGLYAKAISTYVHIYSLYPQTLRRDILLFRLGESNYRLGKYEDARNFLGDCISREPLSEYSRRARLVRAQCLLKTGQKDKAEADLRALVQERQLRGKEFYAEGCLALAGMEKDSGKSLQAAATAGLGVFSPLANRYYLDCLRLAADAFVTAGKPADAAALYAKAQTEVASLTEGTAAQRKALTGQCSLGYADMLFLSGDRKKALSMYLKAAANVSKPSEKSWAVFQSAELLLRDGKTKEAKLLYSRLSKVYPGTYWEKQAQWRLQTMKQKKPAPAAEVK